MITRLKNRLLPSIADFIFCSLLLYLSLPPGKGLLNDGDTGYHILAGEYILNNLSIPKNDIFSYITPPISWTAHEWLSEVIMAIFHRLGGLTAVVILFAIILSATVRTFFKMVQSEGNNIFLSIAASIALIATAKVHWLARPHIFSFLILLLWYRALDDFQYRNKNNLWVFPILMLLWVNLHGGYILGLVLMSVYLAGNCIQFFMNKLEWEKIGKEKMMRLGRTFGLTILACFLNPFGYRIFLFPFNLIFDKYLMDHTSEFMSPNFHEIQPFKYLLILFIVLVATSQRKLNFIEIVLTILLTSMSLTSIRYTPLFGIIVIPIILRHFKYDTLSRFPAADHFYQQRIQNITSVDAMAKGFFWPLASIIFITLLAMNKFIVHSFDPDKKPLVALEFLKRYPVPGNMFNNDEFGDFVIYSLNKEYKVFVDGRGDMYGAERFKEYSRISDFEPGWENIMNKYKITWIFFNTDSVFSRFLINNDDWRLIYSDKVASIFVKNIPLYETLITKFSGVSLYGYNTGIIDHKI